MTTTIDRSSIVVRQTAPRMTPPPVSRQFREVLVQGGRAIINGAVAAAAFVPGGNMLAAAVRGAGLQTLAGVGSNNPSTGTNGTVEGPPQSLEYSTNGDTTVLGGSTSGGTSGGTGTPGSGASGNAPSQDDVLQRGQEMSMRMLRLQEAMGEENRRYTALSNVLHARHEMAKTAIGNIR